MESPTRQEPTPRLSPRHTWLRLTLTIAITLVGVAAVSWVRPDSRSPQTSASYQIPFSAIVPGADRSTSASFTLDGTAGQPGSVPFRMVGDSFLVTSGFWSHIETGSFFIFGDGFESGTTNSW